MDRAQTKKGISSKKPKNFPKRLKRERAPVLEVMAQTLQDLTILLLVSLPINILFHRIKLPSIMGFLIAGMLIGPHGLELIGDPESVENLSQIGVILLLFIIGLEFSLSSMLKNLFTIIGAGGLQLGLTTAAVYSICLWMGFPHNQACQLKNKFIQEKR